MTRRNPTRPNGARSVRELAAILGRSKSTVGEWLALPGWPVRRSAPWPAGDVDRIREWASERTAARHAGTDEERRARLAVLRERARTLKLNREILAGRYIDREEAEAGLVQRVYSVKRAVLALSRILAADLAGQPPAAFPRIIDERCRELLLAYTNDIDAPPWLGDAWVLKDPAVVETAGAG